MNAIPVYEHDCDKCVFIGNTPCSSKYVPKGILSVDLYVCKNGPGTTFIARYGNDGGDYMSGFSPFWFFRDDMRDYPLVIAVKEAMLRGLIAIEATTTDLYHMWIEEENAE